MSVDQSASAIAIPKMKSARLFVVFAAQDKKDSSVDREARESRMEAFSSVLLDSISSSAVSGSPIVHPQRHLSSQVWAREVGGLPVSDDLSIGVVDALSGHARDAATLAAPGLHLSPAGLNFVNGRYAIPEGDPFRWDTEDEAKYISGRSGLSLRLSNAAKRRLGTMDGELLVSIDQMFVIFPSQFCMIVAELSVSSPHNAELTPLAIEEANHILCNKNRARDCGLASFKNPVKTGLQDLVQLVLPAGRFTLFEKVRIFNYALIVLESFPQSIASIEALAFRCSRHFTTDYQVNSDEIAMQIYSPFKSVVHSFALESAATVVDGSDIFLCEQFMTRVRQVYLWLIILACHEQSHLVWLTHRDDLLAGTDKERSYRLRKLIRDFLHFRVLHSIPLVSHIEMHNQIYDRLRCRLLIHELIQKMALDIIEMERFIAEQIEKTRVEDHERRDEAQRGRDAEKARRKARRQKYGRWEVGISGFLMFGLTFLAFDTLTRKLAMLIYGVPELAQPWNVVLPVAIGLIAGVVRGWQVHAEIYDEPASEDPLFDAVMDEDTIGESSNVEAGVGVVSVGTHK